MKNLLAKWTYYIAIELDSKKSPLFCNILQENQSKQYNKLKNLELNWPNKMYIRDIWNIFPKILYFGQAPCNNFLFFRELFRIYVYSKKFLKQHYEIQLWNTIMKVIKEL